MAALRELAEKLAGHIELGDLGGQLVFSHIDTPPALVLPPEGVPLKNLLAFVKDVLGGHLGLPPLTGFTDDDAAAAAVDAPGVAVFLTRFEIDLADELKESTIFLSLELRGAHWPLIPDGGVLGENLAIDDPGLTIGRVAGAWELAVHGTLELPGGEYAIAASWPDKELTAAHVGEKIEIGALLEQLGGPPGFHWDIDEIFLSANLTARFYSFALGLERLSIPDVPFALGKTRLEIQHEPDRKPFCSVTSRVRVGGKRGIDVDVSGAYRQGHFKFSGRSAPGEAIKIGELIAKVAEDCQVLESASVPEELASLEIVALGVAIDSAAGSFELTCEADFDVDGKEVDLGVAVRVEKGEKHLGGYVVVGGMEFDLKFEQTTAETEANGAEAHKASIFAAEFRTSRKLDLHGLVRSLTSKPAVLDLVPEKLEIALDGALFAYRSTTGQPSQYLLGVSLDLSGLQLDLGKLPVVGGEFKGGDKAGLEHLQVVVSNREVLSSEVTAFNEVLALDSGPSNASASLPAVQLAVPEARSGGSAAKDPPVFGRGFNIAATLKLGPAGGYSLFSGDRAKPAPKGGAPSPATSSPAEDSETGAAEPTPQAQPTTGGDATWFETEVTLGPVHLDKIGGRYKDGRLWLLLTGGLKAGPMDLSLQGLGVGFELADLTKGHFDPDFSLDGLGLAFAAGPLRIDGAFLRSLGDVYDDAGRPTGEKVTQYAGEVKVQAEAFSIQAVGAYGKMAGGDPSVFIYGVLSAAEGQGIHAGPITITALALGFGINRRVLIPPIEGVSGFPMVSMVMGPSGANADALVPAAQADPAQILAKMSAVLPAQQGQYFGALGLRFSLFETIDCFALAIVQGGRDLEISILGVGRFKKPDEGKAICYVEIDLLIDIHPSAGILKMRAQLANSWVLDGDCQLTGGFALYIWSGGDHRGDFVITLGGYHPAFSKPAWYPVVPRLGLNWHLSSRLSIKGGLYFAITPSAFMAGGSLEAAFRAGPVGADFVAYAHFLIQWKPLHYDIRVGISIRAYAHLVLFTIHINLSVDLRLQGPPVHGLARLKVGPVSVAIKFGEQSGKPPLIKDWPEFGRSFLDRTDADGKAADADDKSATGKWKPAPSREEPVPGPIIHQLQLVRGRTTNPAAAAEDAAAKTAERWFVRADELEMAFTTAIPATSLRMAQIKTNSPTPAGLPIPIPDPDTDDPWTGRPLTVADAMELGDFPRPKSTTLPAKHFESENSLGIRPMGHRSVDTGIRVTVFREFKEGSGEGAAIDRLEDWLVEVDRSAVPAALWDPEAANTEAPSAKTIPGSLTGVARLKPPTGGPRGTSVGPVHSEDLNWDDLTHKFVPIDAAEQPAASEQQRRPAIAGDVQAKTDLRAEIAHSLRLSGFAEAESFQHADDGFRPLYAAPLAAAVAVMKTRT